MRISVVTCLLMAFATSSCTMRRSSDSSLRYVGEDSTRTKLEFTASVAVEVPTEYGSDLRGILTTDFAEIALETISLQTVHLFGVFMEHPDFVDTPGGPRNRPTINMRSAQWLDKDQRLAAVKYDYRDIFAFSKDLIGKRQSGTINFRLPTNPATIFAAGIPPRGSINRCTDDTYNSEGDHWYFWNPYKKDCPYRRELDSETTAITATFERLPSTEKSYPYYNDLYADNQLDIAYFVGVDVNKQKGDLGRQNFDRAVGILINEHGFAAIENKKNAKKLTRTNADGLVVNIDARLFDQGDKAFASATVKALASAEIYMYTGHSGLGYFLDPLRLKDDAGKRVQLLKDRQQILYFDGCSTFAYYNQDYLQLKHPEIDWTSWQVQVADRSPTLDIFTTTVGSPFDEGPERDIAFIRSFIEGRRPSWQTIVRNIYQLNPSLSALVQINGDADNPTTNGK